MATTYSIVHFYQDNSVAAVPKFWYSVKNGTCAWPKKPHNPKKLIALHSIPNKMEYDFFEARVMSSGIESLTVAQAKAKKAMYISDIDEDDVKPKTKKLKPSINCPVFSENDIGLDDVSQKSVLIPEVNTEKCNYYSQPTSSYVKSYNVDKSHVTLSGWSPSQKATDKEKYISPDNISENIEIDSKKWNFDQPSSHGKSFVDKSPALMSGWSPSPRKAAAKDQIRSASLETINSVTKRVISPKVSRRLNFDHEQITLNSNTRDRKKSFTPIQTIGSDSQLCSSSNSAVDNSTQKILKSLLRNVMYLQTDIKHISMQQMEILTKLDNSTSNIKNSKCSSNNEFIDDFNWPINDLEHLDIIEEKIKDRNMRDYLVNDLSHLGGNSVKAIMKRIIYKLFTDVLLSNFSFSGKKGKQKFCKLNLCSVIFDAVKNQTKVKNVDQNEMEERLKYHLAQAPFSVKRCDKINENI